MIYDAFRQINLTNLSAIFLMLDTVTNKISNRSKTIILICLGAGAGLAIATVPICLTIISLNSDRVNLKTSSVEIELSGKGKQLTAVDDSFNKKLESDFNQLKQELNNLKNQAKKKKVDRVLAPELKRVEQKVDQTEIRLHDATESSEELKEFVEDAIAPVE